MSKELAQLLFPNVDKTIEYYEDLYPERNLDKKAKVTRLGPSPTGFIHLGNLYGALVDERIAHLNDGTMLLRIEDTDDKRKVEGSEELIIRSLKFFGIEFDEVWLPKLAASYPKMKIIHTEDGITKMAMAEHHHHDEHDHSAHHDDHDHDAHHEHGDKDHEAHEHHHHHHHHDGGEVEEYGIGTFVYYRRKPFDLVNFDRFIAEHWPHEVIRCKGICWFKDEPQTCYVFEQAGKQMGLRNAGQWYATMPEKELKPLLATNEGLRKDWNETYGDRMQKLVFIGQHLNREKITAYLDEILVD